MVTPLSFDVGTCMHACNANKPHSWDPEILFASICFNLKWLLTFPLRSFAYRLMMFAIAAVPL